MTTIWEMKKKEQIDPAEAADKLLSIVREVKELDEHNDTVNRRKAALFSADLRIHPGGNQGNRAADISGSGRHRREGASPLRSADSRR
jgi:hypothetical protein